VQFWRQLVVCDRLIGAEPAGCLASRGPLLLGVTMASNVLTLAARANVSYSVSLTTTATLLSAIMVPAVLLLTLGRWQAFSTEQLVSMSLTLCWTVVLPVVAGHLLSRAIRFWAVAAPTQADATGFDFGSGYAKRRAGDVSGPGDIQRQTGRRDSNLRPTSPHAHAAPRTVTVDNALQR
jgi:hypothetical protein